MDAFVRFALQSASLVCALASSASASTWIVDDDGGVGVDFTDIQPAIDASRDGDVIQVRPGEYGGFSIQDRGVRVLGGPGVRCHAGIVIGSVPAGALVVVSGVVFDGARDQLAVVSTSGTVIVQSLVGGLFVSSCADVRALDVVGAVRSVDSRFELSRAFGQGPDGESGLHPTPGVAGIDLYGGKAHVVLCSSTGGRGGDLYGDEFSTATAGAGGAGLRVVWDGSALVAGGASNVFQGGGGGDDYSYWGPTYCGHGGPGLSVPYSSVDALLSWSGVTALGGPGGSTCNSGPEIQGVSTHVSPDDPTLEWVGHASPGERIRFRVRGPAGAQVELVLGRTPIVVPDGVTWVERLTTRDVVLALGTLPASGELDRDVAIGRLPPGTVLVGQAELVLPFTNEVRRTNSASVVVR